MKTRTPSEIARLTDVEADKFNAAQAADRAPGYRLPGPVAAVALADAGDRCSRCFRFINVAEPIFGAFGSGIWCTRCNEQSAATKSRPRGDACGFTACPRPPMHAAQWCTAHAAFALNRAIPIDVYTDPEHFNRACVAVRGCERCGAEPGTPCDPVKHDARGYDGPGSPAHMQRIAADALALATTSEVLRHAARLLPAEHTAAVAELRKRAAWIETAAANNGGRGGAMLRLLKELGEVRS